MRRLFLASLVILTAATAVRAQDITDDQIRDVVTRVARHQLIPQADGDYAPVSSLEQAQAARAPTGIAWFYPQGVMLYGLSRSTDVTHDREVGQFVIRHYQVASRYYHWLDLDRFWPWACFLTAAFTAALTWFYWKSQRRWSEGIWGLASSRPLRPLTRRPCRW